MTLWHADANGPRLAPGSEVLIHSPDRVVRVITADQLSIETTSGNRLTGTVLDRTGADLTLAMPESAPLHLSILSDNSLVASAEDAEFSRQLWLVH